MACGVQRDTEGQCRSDTRAFAKPPSTLVAGQQMCSMDSSACPPPLHALPQSFQELPPGASPLVLRALLLAWSYITASLKHATWHLCSVSQFFRGVQKSMHASGPSEVDNILLCLSKMLCSPRSANANGRTAPDMGAPQ